jgi:putative membrane protein insertion efficiency factor
VTDQLRATRRRTSPVAWLLIAPIRFYQKFITPYTPATCRYYPTCSEYAVRSLRTHGAVKGTILTIWRLVRCNPWSSGGVDHTPERGRWRHIAPPAPDDDGSEPDSRDRASAGNGVIHVDRSLHTCGAGIRGADESAWPAGGAPSAGRTAA